MDFSIIGYILAQLKNYKYHTLTNLAAILDDGMRDDKCNAIEK
jgi:hypothetical protein